MESIVCWTQTSEFSQLCEWMECGTSVLWKSQKRMSLILSEYKTRIHSYSHVLPQGNLHVKFAHDTKFMLPRCWVSTQNGYYQPSMLSNVYVSKK
jgi:hypothetical protein